MFKEAWCYFVTATELNKKPKERQAGTLCRVMGINCVKVMNSLIALIHQSDLTRKTQKTLCLSWSQWVHKRQFEDTADSPNTAHTACRKESSSKTEK